MERSLTPDLNPKPGPRGSNGHHTPGTPIHLALLGLLMLALLSLAAVGYVLYLTNSDRARIQREMEKATLATKEAQAESARMQAELDRSRKAAELEKAKRQAEAQAVLARNHQTELLRLMRGATNNLTALLQNVERLSADCASLLTNQQGKAITVLPDLLPVARRFYGAGLTDLPTREDVIGKLEATRRLAFQLLDLADTAAEPEASLAGGIQENAAWAEAGTRRARMVREAFQSLVRESQIKVPEKPVEAATPTLEAAIHELTLAEAAQAQKVAAQRVAQAQAEALDARTKALVGGIQESNQLEIQKLQDEVKRLKDLAVIDKELRDAETDRQRFSARQTVDATRVDLEKKQMQAKAQTAAVKRLLAPFISTGHTRASWIHSRAPQAEVVGPVSYNDISAIGALKPDIEGLRRLVAIATNRLDHDRPRWPHYNKNPKAWEDDPILRRQAEQAQQLLIELGPTMVEMGMLLP